MPELAEPVLGRFFDEAAAEYAQAASFAGERHYELMIAGRSIGLRVAGQTLAEALLPAFGRRVTSGQPVEPDVTVSMWEEVSCPSGAAPVPWRADDLGPRGLVDMSGDGVVAVHNAAVTLAGLDRRSVLYRVSDVRTLEWFELRSPLRPGLFFALASATRHLVHGGVVGDQERGGVLIAGASGSGKTTVSLAALAGGFAYVSDDYCLLDMASTPTAWNIFGNAKLDAGHRARFPEFGAATYQPGPASPDEKAVLDVSKLLPTAVAESLPIRCVLCPSITGGQTSWRRISEFQGLLALAPSTSLQMPFDGGSVVTSLVRLARSVPCFALDVGDNPSDLCVALDAVLTQSLTRS